MGRRIDLHEELCLALGSRHVYFQPPESVKLSYPCIIYDLAKMETTYANNKTYNLVRGYDVTYITKDPDSALVDSLPTLFAKCRFDRFFVNDNLNHYVYTIYY